MKKFFTMLTVLSICLWAGSLFAYPVNLYEISVSPATAVNVTFPGYSGGVWTGVYNVAIDFTPLDGTSTFQNFAGYCVDPAWSNSTSTLYDIIAVPENSIYEKAAYLFSKYGTPADATLAANIQLAIWSLTFPSFTINDASWLASSTIYYNEANNLTVAQLLAFDSSPFSIAHSPGIPGGANYQDYVIHTPVPEPATMLLLGFGLVGLAGIRRKFKK